MPFTAEQIEQVMNSTLDFYMDRGKKPVNQHIQDKPLLSKLRPKQKSIPGGQGRVSMPVVLETQSQLQGFEYDDSVSYGSPAKNRRVSYPFRLFHIGIETTMHELIHDGISIETSGKTSEYSDRELVRLTNIFEQKIADMDEGFDKDMNLMFWRDGTQSSLAFPGVTSFVVDTPTAGTVVGGIDQSSNSKWRNRASLSISLGASAATQAVLRTLDAELPQLRRYGGKPNTAFCGSDMIDRLKAERRAGGYSSMSGFSDKQDMSVGDMSFDGLTFFYDPTLDDLGYSKRMYVLEIGKPGIFPFVVEGEDEKKHMPARPADQYVFYQAKTWVGGMACNRRNGCGVYAFA